MRSLLYVSALLALAIACTKDKLETTPSLKFKSVNATTIPVGGTLIVQLDFADKQGDISDTIFVRKVRINRIVVPTIRDSFALQVPDFPDRSRGVIELQLKYQNHLLSAINPPSHGNPPNLDDDTLIFKFVLQDKAKHTSDTVTTEPIVIVR
ncbi:MAG TPA: hypothetical protein VKA49_12550 [Flavitalea sp.]|nr:hypothetical protein [Flavitalea sp.]